MNFGDIFVTFPKNKIEEQRKSPIFSLTEIIEKY